MTTREALAGLLILLGLAAATVAGFLVHAALGLAVFGVTCLLLGAALARDVETVVELTEVDDAVR